MSRPPGRRAARRRYSLAPTTLEQIFATFAALQGQEKAGDEKISAQEETGDRRENRVRQTLAELLAAARDKGPSQSGAAVRRAVSFP